MNPGALAGGRPGGAPALGADQAVSVYADLSARIDDYDQQVYDALDELGISEDRDPPDDVFVAEALTSRLKGAGFFELVPIGGGHSELKFREDLSSDEMQELMKIHASVKAWRHGDAETPGWALQTVKRREKFLTALRELWGNLL